MYGSENENVQIEAVDNGFIVRMFIPLNYNPQVEAMGQMAERIIKVQEKIIDNWKEEAPALAMPDQKQLYTFVCKDEKEVLKIVSDFFKRVKK